jgi:hypothetical protein
MDWGEFYLLLLVIAGFYIIWGLDKVRRDLRTLRSLDMEAQRTNNFLLYIAKMMAGDERHGVSGLPRRDFYAAMEAKDADIQHKALMADEAYFEAWVKRHLRKREDQEE